MRGVPVVGSRLATLLAIVGTTSGCIATPVVGIRLDANVQVSGDVVFEREAVFEIPASLDVDCASYARRGLHEGQRFLQVIFVPVELDERPPLQQLSVALPDYGGPGTYSLDPQRLAVTVRMQRLTMVDGGSTLVMRVDGSGEIQATGRWERGGAAAVTATFRCASGPRVDVDTP